MDIQSTARKAGRKVGRMLSAGEADILDLLQQDHDAVEDLLDKLVESRNGSERKSLLTKIKGALVPHVRAEEKVVYDAVIAIKGKRKHRTARKDILSTVWRTGCSQRSEKFPVQCRPNSEPLRRS